MGGFKKPIIKQTSNSENRTYKPQVEKYRKNVGAFHEQQDEKVNSIYYKILLLNKIYLEFLFTKFY